MEAAAGSEGATNDNDDGRINKTALEGWRRDGDILPQDLATFATVCSFIVRCQSAQRGQLTLPTTTRAIAVAAGGKAGKSGDGIGEYIDKKRGYRRHIGDAILTPSVRLFVCSFFARKRTTSPVCPSLSDTQLPSLSGDKQNTLN